LLYKVSNRKVVRCPISFRLTSICLKPTIKTKTCKVNSIKTTETYRLQRHLYSTENQPQSKNPPPVGKIRQFFQTYGKLGLAVWGTMWVAGIPVAYLLLTSGIFFKGDVMTLLLNAGVDKWISLDNIKPWVANAIVAFLMVKAMEPIRLPLVVVISAWLKRVLDKRKLSQQQPK